jgi:hypothetical protein
MEREIAFEDKLEEVFKADEETRVPLETIAGESAHQTLASRRDDEDDDFEDEEDEFEEDDNIDEEPPENEDFYEEDFDFDEDDDDLFDDDEDVYN